MDSNGEVTYWIKNSHGHFEIDSQSGHIRLTNPLPPQTQKNMTYEMEIFARDHGAASNIGKAILVVRVSNTRNHPPKFEKFGYRVAVDENSANVDLVNVHAYDPDSGPAGRFVKYVIFYDKIIFYSTLYYLLVLIDYS